MIVDVFHNALLLSCAENNRPAERVKSYDVTVVMVLIGLLEPAVHVTKHLMKMLTASVLLFLLVVVPNVCRGEANQPSTLLIHPANGEIEYNSRTPIVVKYPAAVNVNPETLKVLLDNKDVSKRFAQFPNGAIDVPSPGLTVGPHNLEVKIADDKGKVYSADAKFTIGKEVTEPLTVKFNVDEHTLLPSNMSQMWLQGDCSQSTITATVSVNFGPDQEMSVRAKTFGTFVNVESKNVFVVTVSNTVTHAHYTYLPGN